MAKNKPTHFAIAKNEEQAKKLADERGNWGEPIEEQNGGDREIEVSESKGANLWKILNG